MSYSNELYQQVILEHNKKPRNFGALEDCSHSCHGHNPLCGDMVTIYLIVEGGVVQDVKFDGKGCAISMASASIMTGLVVGKPEADIRSLFESFHSFVTDDDREDLGDGFEELTALGGVRDYPMRVKCATLAWHTLTSAITNTQEEINTEKFD